MQLKQKRLFWFIVWLIIVLSGPVTVLKNASISFSEDNLLQLINVFQRLTGLVGFSLIFSQIILGAFMDKWVQILGARAYRAHITQGLLAYAFILLHPLMQTVIDFNLSGLSGAILTLLPGRDIYLNFGKIGLLLSTLAVFIAYFRTKPIFRRVWKRFHILNYAVFFFVSYHALNLGTDINTFPFVLVHRGAFIAVGGIVIFKGYSVLTANKFRFKIN